MFIVKDNIIRNLISGYLMEKTDEQNIQQIQEAIDSLQ